MQKTAMSISEFEGFVDQVGNEDRLLELIAGEVIESFHVPTAYSQTAHLLSFAVHEFCQLQDTPCHISGVLGAYNILGHVITPNFAYKPTSMSMEFADPEPPLWAVEVIAPTDKAVVIRHKRQIYREAGILLWEIYRPLQLVDVYAPGQPVRTLGIDDTLDGGEVLPGFRLAVKELFAE